MAMGATTSRILRGVLAQGLRVVWAGIAVGTVITLAAARLATGLVIVRIRSPVSR